MKTNKIRYTVFIIVLCIVSLAVFQFNKGGRMSDNWVAPYLSCARNLSIGGDFLINLQEVKHFQNLNADEQDNYKFKKENNLIPYKANPIGFAYFIKIATTLFFFLGDENALFLFHFLIHLSLCLLLMKYIKSTRIQILFFIFYACNPFILRYVIFNFYYIYQVIPSFILLFMLYKKPLPYFLTMLSAVLLALVFLTRPTVLLLIFIISFYLYYHYGWKKFLVYASVFFLIFIVINRPNEKNPWFTAYVGLGAYDNKYVNKLSDNAAYDLYKKETGKPISASVGGNYYDDSTIIVFREILKNRWVNIFQSNPFYIIRNAALNFFSAFSIGYLSFANLSFKIIIACSGLFIFLWLIVKRKFKWIIIISFASLGFTPYYPPIPAYMFGSYILLFFALYELLKTTKFEKYLESSYDKKV